MRILVDTNILFSAVLKPNSMPAKAVESVVSHHSLVLCDQNIAELRRIVELKRPDCTEYMETFLEHLFFEEISVGDDIVEQIRDAKDQPILNAAIEEDVDIILTGDKDFLSLNIKRPKCMSVSDFMKFEKAQEQFNES